MPHGRFEFKGQGINLFGIYILNAVLTFLTLGLYAPWAFVAVLTWVTKNSYVEGQQLTFKGTGVGFFGTYLLIVFLSFITLGIYIPWGMCRFMRWQAANTYFADAGDNEAV